MYTSTSQERETLSAVMQEFVLPAVQSAIRSASEALVCEVEGFHPDSAHSEHVALAADEITARLSEYFAGLSYKGEDGLYEKINTEDLTTWLQRAG